MFRHDKTFQNSIKISSNVYKKRKEYRTNAQWGKNRDCLFSSASQLPLAFQVCSVRLYVLESQPCWSREQAHQSTALRVCSGPVPRATEDKWKITLMTLQLLQATGIGASSDLPPASRCASVRLFASVSQSCWSPAPSRP